MPKFHFRLVPCIVTLLLVALGCALSYWQIQRARQKEAIEVVLQSRSNLAPIALPDNANLHQLEYTRVTLTGEFVTGWPLYLDNRPMNGLAGIVVLMPFRLRNQNKVVMVSRGWVPRNNLDRAIVKHYDTPSGTIQIVGVVKANSGHVYQFIQNPPLKPGALLQNIELEEISRAIQADLLPFVVEQTSGPNDGLLRDWPRASMGSERHRGYAFQWIALAMTSLLFFLVTSFRKQHGTKPEQS